MFGLAFCSAGNGASLGCGVPSPSCSGTGSHARIEGEVRRTLCSSHVVASGAGGSGRGVFIVFRFDASFDTFRSDGIGRFAMHTKQCVAFRFDGPCRMVSSW